MKLVFVLAERALQRGVVRAILRERFPHCECAELATPAAARDALAPRQAAICIAASSAAAAVDPATSALLGEMGGRLLEVSDAEFEDIGALFKTLPERLKVALTALGAASALDRARDVATNTKPASKIAPRSWILVASSTGGPTALVDLLGALPLEGPPWIVAQHMPASGAAPFANHIAARTGREAIVVGGVQALAERRIHLLEGGRDYGLAAGHGRIEIRPLASGDSPFHPNADRLFASAAELGVACVAIVLSGMGRDGAEGCARLAAAGSTIFAQRPDTCVVPGMPEAARSNLSQAILFDPAQPPDLLRRLCAPTR